MSLPEYGFEIMVLRPKGISCFGLPICFDSPAARRIADTKTGLSLLIFRQVQAYYPVDTTQVGHDLYFSVGEEIMQ